MSENNLKTKGVILARNVGLSEKTTASMKQSLEEWGDLLNPLKSDEEIAAHYGSDYKSDVKENKQFVKNIYEEQETDTTESSSSQNTNESRIERLKNTIENGFSKVSNLTQKSAESIETADDYFID